MARLMKTAKTVRDEAVEIVRGWIAEREETGDPEGAGVMRMLRDEIKAIRLTFDSEK